MANIFRCKNCKRMLMAEELDSHACKSVVLDYRIEGDLLYVSDGELWYPLKLLHAPTKSEQPDRNTRKGNTTRLLVVLNQWLF
ncbi:MAG TPA: hypothetical protein VFZ55_02450 [Nitrososphaera sp.]